ncbi:MAG TPA: SDR family NAD(P)-dependent oxidoreductase [Edaphobacter sp.]|nr:SDR family NAD(P)-dependent oxidoreductase [Edaphobacter sp.]
MQTAKPLSNDGLRRAILITGASSGIGRATALRLVRHGWRVFATVRKESDAEALRSAAQGDLEIIYLDVADPASIAAAAREVEHRLEQRGLDALLNNAGIGMTAPVEHTSLDQLRHIFEVNLFGQIAVIQAFLPLVRRAKGRIVNIGSVGDHITPPFGGALAASKAAFASMSSALRLELRPQGIHVCIVEPGSINTPAVDKTLGGVEEKIASLPPDAAKRYGAAMRKAIATFSAKEHAGSPPEAVAKVVERALTDRNPKTRYPAGKDSRKLSLLARFLPERLLDRAALKVFGLPTTFGRPVQ